MEDKKVELAKDEIIANQKKELQRLADENCLLVNQAREVKKEAEQLREDLRRAGHKIGRLREAIVNCFLSKWE